MASIWQSPDAGRNRKGKGKRGRGKGRGREKGEEEKRKGGKKVYLPVTEIPGN